MYHVIYEWPDAALHTGKIPLDRLHTLHDKPEDAYHILLLHLRTMMLETSGHMSLN